MEDSGEIRGTPRSPKVYQKMVVTATPPLNRGGPNLLMHFQLNT